MSAPRRPRNSACYHREPAPEHDVGVRLCARERRHDGLADPKPADCDTSRYWRCASLSVQTKGRSTMKRVLIAIASVGVLAPTAWVVEANAQYGSPPPAYSASPANSPSQAYAQRYTRPARRSARRTPSGGTAFTPGSGPPPYSVSSQAYAAQSSAPFEWYAAPGPNKRGNECITHVDSTRYGFRGACKK